MWPRLGTPSGQRLLSLVLLVPVATLTGCPRKTSSDVGCVSCHDPLGEDGTRHGIEDAHPWLALSCESCHGGDPAASTLAEAHVAVPSGLEGPTHLRSLTSLELDEVDPGYVRWVNPSDYRVIDQTCGRSACHEQIAATAPTSIMTTFAGHLNKTRYYAGAQDDRSAIYGVRSQSDPAWDGAVGTVGSLEPLVAPPLDDSSTMGDYLDHYLEKGCPRCHVWNFGPNDAHGDFRSSGCAGCHVVYENDGLSQSEDPTANRDDPPHPRVHEMTSAIPDYQCEHCHYRGNRIGTMYRGVREKARFGDPEDLEVSVEPLHTQQPGFFVFDEDTTNDVDETPPDVHQSAGLGCVDCHVGVDVHGDGRLYSAHDYQVGIECEDCHGTATAPIAPDATGVYRTTGGDPLRMIRRGDDGLPVLTGRLDGEDHPLVQLADLGVIEGHEAAHTDTLECYACHTAWTQSCFGCHVTVDTRYESKSLLDGSMTPGLTGGTRSWVALDHLALGIGTDGLITPMAPQEKMFVTVIVPCDPETETCTEGLDTETPGRRVLDQQVRITHDGLLGMGFGPVVPHTTSSGSQPCDRCHLREDASNEAILAETFGWGSGRFVIADGDGVAYDLTQVVDGDGECLVGLAHEGTDVLPPDLVERMLVPRVPSSGLELKEYPAWQAP